ncbi:hypothetical protein IFM89_010841 [Coptis chinensis]|uniref:Uncharacterized protein n=1 Tax=Coptis chinensis TaxID=261450 RepID=A0A835LZD1_9MAGN|nr:hypothetical protein IFM89_010841 [Coptis chinensis]
MDSERPHRSGTSTTPTSSDLFICFTSRPSFSSSSSMKLSGKSILSPGRSDKYREPTLSYSSSRRRLVRSNGSIKGGHSSPMFQIGSRKRGYGFENAEPSSPKVTCIGQVRVKTKKQGKKMMNMRSNRRKMERTTPQGGILQEKKEEECLPHRNQKWVHLPLTICEALRGFGSEFNCFLPCGGRNTCSSRDRGEKRRTMSSCGAVFAKWLMAMQEGEEEKRREIRIMVGEEEEEEKGEKGDDRRFDEIVMGIEEEKRLKESEEFEFEEARVGTCIPPRNALLLMRCRSEPLRMSALANRFWAPIQVEDADDDGESEDENEEEERYEEDMLDEDCQRSGLSVNLDSEEVVEDHENMVKEENPWKEQLGPAEIVEELEKSVEEEVCLMEECVSAEVVEDQESLVKEEDQLKEQSGSAEGSQEHENSLKAENSSSEQLVKEETQINGQGGSAELVEENGSLIKEEGIPLKEQCVSAEIDEEQENSMRGEMPLQEQWGLAEVVEEHEKSEKDETPVQEEEEQHLEKEDPQEEQGAQKMEFKEVTIINESSFESIEVNEIPETEEAKIEQGVLIEEKKEDESNCCSSNEETLEGIEIKEKTLEEEEETEQEEQLEGESPKVHEKKKTELPDCLLMMLWEPKLSMEVSKETWVCSTDFIQRRPKQQIVHIDGGDESSRSKDIKSSNPAQQLNQQSCHPVPSMTTMIEQKLMNAVAYEPFVLTRCKSEPLRTSARLVPEACSWKNRQLGPPSYEAGVGF